MMPAGEYYVGDICYVMHPEWDEVCDLICCWGDEDKETDGEFTLKDGRRFAVYGTAYGDGCYYDQTDRSYGVDAGIIGCIRVDDIAESERKNLEDGHVMKFEKDFITYSDAGIIYFGNVAIDTTGELYNDDDDYSDCYYEEEEE